MLSLAACLRCAALSLASALLQCCSCPGQGQVCGCAWYLQAAGTHHSTASPVPGSGPPVAALAQVLRLQRPPAAIACRRMQKSQTAGMASAACHHLEGLAALPEEHIGHHTATSGRQGICCSWALAPVQCLGSWGQQGSRGLGQLGERSAEPCQHKGTPPGGGGACVQPAWPDMGIELTYTRHSMEQHRLVVGVAGQ